MGRFNLIETVGHGGFGTVYKARDPELDRVVAVKVPRTGNLAGPQELDRFLREARSVAQLRHPSIVSIHEVGQQDGVPYLVSDFVKGVTLADLLSARRPGFREAAELVAAVVDALQYAHERGVVHRDVKPSNIMIGEDGTPCVMDFGLAKREAGEITMTVEGQVLGTPAYMPPEQARGEGHAVDARGDVYSLGVVLYQLLTGELPFRGTQRMLLHQVLHDEPRPPRSLNDHIPRDLETITLKAMAKEPARRYATARELADDLRRWLKGEPIQARPVGRAERAIRWATRRPAAAALLLVSGVAALALVGVVVGAIYNGQLETAYQSEASARKREEDQRKAAEAARSAEEVERAKADEARREAVAAHKKTKEALEERDQTVYGHSILMANLALAENKILQAQQRLGECEEKLRGWEWHYLNSQCHTELLSRPGEDAVFSPDGARIAVTEGNVGLRVYDVRTGREVLIIKSPAPFAVGGRPAFSPDGTRILVGTRQGSVLLYDTRNGQAVLTIQGRSPLGNVAFSPDGSRIAAIDQEDMLRVYDAQAGQETIAIQMPKKRGHIRGKPMFSPDGSRIMANCTDNVVRVYDGRTGRELLSLDARPNSASEPAFSPDGSRLVAVAGLGVRMYDAQTGRELLSFKAPQGLSHPVFSPDGLRVAANGWDHIVRVYDVRTGQEALALKAPTSSGQTFFEPPAFSPDGMRIAVAGRDHLVRVYDARTGQQVLTLRGTGRLGLPMFSPDGTRIATAPSPTIPNVGEGVVRLYDARTSQEALILRGPAGISPAVFSPDGTRIAVAPPGGMVPRTAGDGALRVYDVRTGLETLALKGRGRLDGPVFSRDGSRIAARDYGFGETNDVRVYDARTGREELILKGPTRHRYPLFSPDGTQIAVAPISPLGPAQFRGDGVIRLYDARTGQKTVTLQAPGGLREPVFSPDGSRLVAWDSTGVIRMYDSRSGQEVRSVKGPDYLLGPELSPDGTRLAAQSVGGMVRVYDLETTHELFAVKGGHGDEYLRHLGMGMFSPDGNRMAVLQSVNLDNIWVRVYDARAGRELLALKAPGALQQAVFSPDGTRIIALGDGEVRVYDAKTGQDVLTLKLPAGLTNPYGGGFVLWPVFSPDGTRIAAKGPLGQVVIWEAPRRLEDWQTLLRDRLSLGTAEWHRTQAENAYSAGEWFAAAFHLGHVIQAEPENGHFRYRRGIALAHQRKAAEAKADFEKALVLKDGLSAWERAETYGWLDRREDAARAFADVVKAPNADPWGWWRVALLLQCRGDKEGYARTCADALSRFGETTNPQLRRALVVWCATAPGGLPDMKPVIRLAEAAVQAEPKASYPHWALGMALYRAGRHEEAAKELLVASQLERQENPFVLFGAAMAEHRCGKVKEAQTSFNRAVQLTEKNPHLYWADRLELEIRRREAEAVLKEPPPDPKK